MYRGTGDTVQGLASMGLPADLAGHFVEDEQDVWPENWPALELFSALATQWRVGMSGATGLDYAAVAATLTMLQIDPDDHPERLREIQIMERAALETMNKKP